MTELWQDLTIGQAVTLAVAAWILLWLIDHAANVVRRALGRPIYGDHCEHCGDIEAMQGRLDGTLGHLDTYAHDQLAELTQIRQAVEQAVDERSAV